MWNGYRILLGALAVSFLHAAASASGAAPAPTDFPGLTITYESISTSNKSANPDADLARLVSLFVASREAPSPFTPAGAFRATFEGDINVRLRSYVSFSAEGRGKLTVSVGGKVVLETSGNDLSKVTSDEVRLNKGRNHLVATYESPADGSASLRLLWSSKTWSPEPVPPDVFSHPATAPALAQSLELREGRFQFAQLRCLNCHGDPQLQSPANAEGMPELGADAPTLTDAGARLNAEWIERWVSDPKSLRPDSHMPRVLKNGADPQPARDVAAYLASLGSPPATPPQGDSQAGGRSASLTSMSGRIASSSPAARATSRACSQLARALAGSTPCFSLLSPVTRSFWICSRIAASLFTERP